MGARAGGRLCLQGGDWNSLKQLFNERSAARRAPCRHTRPPERLPVFAAASHPGHTAFPTVEKQPGSESSLLPEQPRACAAAGAALPAGCPPSCRPLCQQAAPGLCPLPRRHKGSLLPSCSAASTSERVWRPSELFGDGFLNLCNFKGSEVTHCQPHCAAPPPAVQRAGGSEPQRDSGM